MLGVENVDPYMHAVLDVCFKSKPVGSVGREGMEIVVVTIKQEPRVAIESLTQIQKRNTAGVIWIVTMVILTTITVKNNKEEDHEGEKRKTELRKRLKV